jgi:hypothetical protein
MGFLKRLFKKEKKPAEKSTINSSELSEWFESKTHDIINKIVHDIGHEFSEIKSGIEDAKKALRELENAKLMNEGITLKEKQFMEGNRLAYIKKVNYYLSKISPGKMSLSETHSFVNNYRKEAIDFSKGSLRAFQITKNFFGDQLDEITKCIKEIDSSINAVSDILNQDNMTAINETKTKIKELNGLIQKREELISSIEEDEKNYEELKVAKADYELKIIRLKKHPAYLELQELNERLKGFEDELKILKSQFLDSFMQVDKALKKVSKLGDEGLIAKYLEDPVSALLSDSELKILDTLRRTKEALEADQLEIEEKKKEKIVTRINEITKEYLVSFVVRHNDFELKKSDVNRLIKQNSSMSDLNELHYKLDHTKDKQVKSTERIKKLNQQLEKLELEETKDKIEENLKNLNYIVKVTI